MRLWLDRKNFIEAEAIDISLHSIGVAFHHAAPPLSDGRQYRLEIRVGAQWLSAPVELARLEAKAAALAVIDGTSVSIANGRGSRLGRLLGSVSVHFVVARPRPRARVKRPKRRKENTAITVNTHFPLEEARLCGDCDRVFPSAYPQCPSCGTEHFTSLASLLARQHV
ncbi:MAG: hypothetical protein HY217_00725 [Candidatus Rokubacteria bacterium]|nr:hypothetical protein [Candidatus Rokubacteria bacterium]